MTNKNTQCFTLSSRVEGLRQSFSKIGQPLILVTCKHKPAGTNSRRNAKQIQLSKIKIQDYNVHCWFGTFEVSFISSRALTIAGTLRCDSG